MSTHIAASQGQIAQAVLFPGDPMRAKYIAHNFLDGAECYNSLRGMFGYTGLYKGMRLSVQGSGMGIPSSLIYANELASFYGVKTIIRVGTCGSLQKDIHVGDIILGMSACTTSGINKTRFRGYDFAPTADFNLLNTAYTQAIRHGLAGRLHVGPVLTTDCFYGHDDWLVEAFARYGVLAVEMEAAGLYTELVPLGVKTLAILTVSDSMVSDEPETAPQDRETALNDMIKLALETALDL